MLRNLIRRLTWAFAAALLVTTPRSVSGSHKPSQLKSFYIVVEAVSDASPFWFDYILEVTPAGDGSLVRWIRIAPLDMLCADVVTVKTAEARLDQVAPAALAGSVDPCSLEVADFDRALKGAHPAKLASVFDSALTGIVADCGQGERRFHLPFPEQLDFDGLKRQSPRVWALWDLYHEVAVKAFGTKSVFYGISDERDAELQRQGAALVPELRSGRFDQGFSGYCNRSSSGGADPLASWHGRDSGDCDPHPSASILEGYRGSLPAFKLPVPSLLNVKELHFSKYVPPEYPPLAKMARIQGQVALSLTLDPATGRVVNATPLWGHALLARSALHAASQWEFDPKAQSTDKPIVAVLSYSWTCP